jgi:hypothetical protein
MVNIGSWVTVVVVIAALGTVGCGKKEKLVPGTWIVHVSLHGKPDTSTGKPVRITDTQFDIMRLGDEPPKRWWISGQDFILGGDTLRIVELEKDRMELASGDSVLYTFTRARD